MIGYPTSKLDLGNQPRSLRPVLLGIASLTLSILVGLAPAFLARRWHRRSLRRTNASAAVSLSDPEAVKATL